MEMLGGSWIGGLPHSVDVTPGQTQTFSPLDVALGRMCIGLMRSAHADPNVHQKHRIARHQHPRSAASTPAGAHSVGREFRKTIYYGKFYKSTRDHKN